MVGGGDASGNPDESFESLKSGVHNCKEQRPSRSECRHLSGPLSFFPMFSHPSKIDATVLADMTPTLSVKVPVVRVSGCHAGEHRAVVTAPASWRGPSVEALRAARSSRRAEQQSHRDRILLHCWGVLLQGSGDSGARRP